MYVQGGRWNRDWNQGLCPSRSFPRSALNRHTCTQIHPQPPKYGNEIKEQSKEYIDIYTYAHVNRQKHNVGLEKKERKKKATCGAVRLNKLFFLYPSSRPIAKSILFYGLENAYGATQRYTEVREKKDKYLSNV